MPIHKLTRSGDSYQVTIPIEIGRRWTQADVVAVQVELVGETVVITPITLRVLRNLRDLGGREEGSGAGRNP